MAGGRLAPFHVRFPEVSNHMVASEATNGQHDSLSKLQKTSASLIRDRSVCGETTFFIPLSTKMSRTVTLCGSNGETTYNPPSVDTVDIPKLFRCIQGVQREGEEISPHMQIVFHKRQGLRHQLYAAQTDGSLREGVERDRYISQLSRCLEEHEKKLPGGIPLQVCQTKT